MWPWESALLGYGVSPWHQADESEIHISGDIPMAFRLYYRANQNDTWLRTQAWESVRDSADFFASRVVIDKSSGNYTLDQVIMPDESAGLHDSNAYTNSIASETMKFALEISEKFNISWPSISNWTRISPNMYIPETVLDGVRIHPEYEGYNGQDINQADVV